MENEMGKVEIEKSVLDEHPEFRILLERLHRLHSGQDLIVGGVNPLVHLTLHSLLENQLRIGKPPETRAALEVLMEQGFSRHRALHILASLLVEEMYPALHDKRSFDNDRYVRRLLLLKHAATDGETLRRRLGLIGRTEPCICGSGVKFKKCCLPLLPLPDLERGAGMMLLEGGEPYVTPGYAKMADMDALGVRLQNMSAVAASQARDLGDREGALETLQEMLRLAEAHDPEKERPGMVLNVLHDILHFCQYHRGFEETGLQVVERLLASTDDAVQRLCYEMDRAELLSASGRADEAEAIFKDVIAEVQQQHQVDHEMTEIVTNRWAWWLEEQGREEEAKAFRDNPPFN